MLGSFWEMLAAIKEEPVWGFTLFGIVIAAGMGALVVALPTRIVARMFGGVILLLTLAYFLGGLSLFGIG